MKQLDPRHLLINIVKILQNLKIPYMVTGGFAVLAWGRPRFTADIDIVIEMKLENMSRLFKALMAIGEYGYLDKEAMEQAWRQKGEFNFIDGETGMKVDFWVSKKDAYEALRFKRRVGKNILSRKIYFVSPEDLILTKLRWYNDCGSTRHTEDAESVLKISGGNIDFKYLKRQAKMQNSLEILERLIKNQNDPEGL